MSTKTINPPVPEELTRRQVWCGEEGCDWPAEYRFSGQPYCGRHGRFASRCEACGGRARWTDLANASHCVACVPEPPLAEQLTALLERANADPRTVPFVAELTTLTETIETATRRAEVGELARQMAERDRAEVGRARVRAMAALAAVPRRTTPTGQQEATDQARFAAAEAELHDATRAAEEASEQERDHRRTIMTAGRARSEAVQRVRYLADQIAQLQAKPLPETRRTLLDRVLGHAS